MKRIMQIIFFMFFSVGIVIGQSSAGNALSFDGSTQYANPISPNVAGYSEGTLEFWFTSDSWSSDEQLWGGGIGLPGTYGDYARIGTHFSVTGNYLSFGMYTSTWLWASALMQPENGKWYHLAATWESAGMKIYIDGELKGQHSHTSALHNYTTELVATSSWGISFDGDIDEMRFWNYALDSTEINIVYQDTLEATYYTTLDSGLVAYYRMDVLEDLGANGDGADDIRDYSVNANHLDTEGISSLDPSGAFPLASSLPNSQISPKHFELKQNYPNPFNPVTNIEFLLSKYGNVKVEIFNSIGEKIFTLLNENKSAGKHSVQFDATGLPSGIYYYQIEAAGIKKSGKMVLIK